MPGTGWTEAVALAAAFFIALLATPARLQSRLRDVLIRRLVGILVVAIACRYLWSGLTG